MMCSKSLFQRISVLLIFSFFFALPEVAAGKKKVVFVRKDSASFIEVFEAMKKDLSDRFEIADFVADKTTSFDDFKARIKAENPQLAVLMDNQAVNFALKYNAAESVPENRIKGVALMALNLKSVLKGNTHIAGVAYECPAYTMLTSFKAVTSRNVDSAVVFYRKSLFGEEIQATAAQLATEKIKLEAVDVEQNGKDAEHIETFLREELPKKAARSLSNQIIWVMLDSGMLTPKLFQEVWVPSARESKQAFLSGTEELVSPVLNFAVYGVAPNLPDLANQAVQMVESILRDGVKPSDLGVENLISVNKVINHKKALDLGIQLSDDKMLDVKVLK